MTPEEIQAFEEEHQTPVRDYIGKTIFFFISSTIIGYFVGNLVTSLIFREINVFDLLQYGIYMAGYYILMGGGPIFIISMIVWFFMNKKNPEIDKSHLYVILHILITAAVSGLIFTAIAVGGDLFSEISNIFFYVCTIATFTAMLFSRYLFGMLKPGAFSLPKKTNHN